jgi:hypothetical protein
VSERERERERERENNKNKNELDKKNHENIVNSGALGDSNNRHIGSKE